MFIVGLYGVNKLEDGLELSDVMAKGTPAYDFLLAREKYFSFYPMQGLLFGFVFNFLFFFSRCNTNADRFAK
jgi:hypothetical protein